MIYPTHGAGSLCSANIAATSWSTLGYERRHDPLLAPMEVDAFARALLAGQPAFPRYFARMRPMNQAGPALLGGVVPAIEPLSGDGLEQALGRGAVVVDARSTQAHAREHPAGSVSIAAGPSFGTWLGWVVDPDAPVVLMVDDVADLDDLARQALRIGYDLLLGYVDGGFDAWRRSGRPVEEGVALDVRGLASELSAGGPEAPLVIDVRQQSEFEGGHIPGSLHIGAGAVARGPRPASARPGDRDRLRDRVPSERGRLAAAGGRFRRGSAGSTAVSTSGRQTAIRSRSAGEGKVRAAWPTPEGGHHHPRDNPDAGRRAEAHHPDRGRLHAPDRDPGRGGACGGRGGRRGRTAGGPHRLPPRDRAPRASRPGAAGRRRVGRGHRGGRRGRRRGGSEGPRGDDRRRRAPDGGRPRDRVVRARRGWQPARRAGEDPDRPKRGARGTSPGTAGGCSPPAASRSGSPSATRASAIRRSAGRSSSAGRGSSSRPITSPPTTARCRPAGATRRTRTTRRHCSAGRSRTPSTWPRPTWPRPDQGRSPASSRQTARWSRASRTARSASSQPTSTSTGRPHARPPLGARAQPPRGRADRGRRRRLTIADPQPRYPTSIPANPSAVTPSSTASRAITRPIADQASTFAAARSGVAHQPPVVDQQDHEDEHDRQQQALEVLRGDDDRQQVEPGIARRARRATARTCRSRRTPARRRTACRRPIPSRTPRRSRTPSRAA